LEGPRKSGSLKVNGTHQFLVCAYDANTFMLGENTNVIKTPKLC